MPATDKLCSSYDTKDWTLYQLSGHEWETEGPDLEADGQPSLIVCHSNSNLAETIGEDPRRFYFDQECEAAGLDPSHGCCVDRLAAPWRDHPIGSLVMVQEHIPSTDLIHQDPQTFVKNLKTYIAIHD